MTNQEYAAGLRHLADWYEAHKNAPRPYRSETVEYIASDKAEVASVLREFGGRWDKHASHGLLYVTRAFGPFTLQLIVDQGEVCTKRVVGYREIPAQEARTVEVVEWDCAPVLAGEVVEVGS